MRELIALRAKIDLRENDLNDELNGSVNYVRIADIQSELAGYKWVKDRIDEMVSKELEEMYAEHIQEEAKADRH